VLFLIELSTRRVEIAGITSGPDAAWMSQVSRNITDVRDGFLTGKRFLIHDRDPLAFPRIQPSRRSLSLAFSVAAAGLLLDGWMPLMRMAAPPARWAEVELPDRPEPILELPIGPDWDWAATFRAAGHRRRVFNGVSGYDPPHYIALRAGLDSRDPSMLTALASLGSFDVVVDGAADADRAWARYVSSVPGAVRVGDDGHRTVYRIPQAPAGICVG